MDSARWGRALYWVFLAASPFLAALPTGYLFYWAFNDPDQGPLQALWGLYGMIVGFIATPVIIHFVARPIFRRLIARSVR